MVKEVIALNWNAEELSLCINDGEVFPMWKIVPTLLAIELVCDVDDVECELLPKLPIKARMQVEGEEITSIAFVE
jgi:hypothetical protein